MKDVRTEGFACNAMVRKTGSVAELTKSKPGKKSKGQTCLKVIVIQENRFDQIAQEQERLDSIVRAFVDVMGELEKGRPETYRLTARDSLSRFEDAMKFISDVIESTKDSASKYDTRRRIFNSARDNVGPEKSVVEVINTLELLLSNHSGFDRSSARNVTVEQSSTPEKTRIVIEVPNINPSTVTGLPMGMH